MRIKYTLLEDLKEDDKQYICKHLTLRQNSLMRDVILGKVHDNFGIKKYSKKLVSIITDGDQKVGSSLILFNKNKTFIFLLFVPKKYRGKGIGSLLLKVVVVSRRILICADTNINFFSARVALTF